MARSFVRRVARDGFVGLSFRPLAPATPEGPLITATPTVAIRRIGLSEVMGLSPLARDQRASERESNCWKKMAEWAGNLQKCIYVEVEGELGVVNTILQNPIAVWPWPRSMRP
jgi:hypothetical protein